MDSVNRIGVNATGVGSKSTEKSGHKEQEAKSPEMQGATARQTVSADKVLDYLAASSVSMVPKGEINPAKYVDDESSARIADFMGQFENEVANRLSVIAAEFPQISADAAQSIALESMLA